MALEALQQVAAPREAALREVVAWAVAVAALFAL